MIKFMIIFCLLMAFSYNYFFAQELLLDNQPELYFVPSDLYNLSSSYMYRVKTKLISQANYLSHVDENNYIYVVCTDCDELPFFEIAQEGQSGTAGWSYRYTDLPTRSTLPVIARCSQRRE